MGHTTTSRSGQSHALLTDWLDTEPGALAGVASVLVRGTAADALALSGAADVVRADTQQPGRVFDLVAAIDRLPANPALPATLARLAAATRPGGRLLIIAAGGPDGVAAHDLAPLGQAGLRLISFDDLTDGSLTGGVDRAGLAGRRWLRAVYARDTDLAPGPCAGSTPSRTIRP